MFISFYHVLSYLFDFCSIILYIIISYLVYSIYFCMISSLWQLLTAKVKLINNGMQQICTHCMGMAINFVVSVCYVAGDCTTRQIESHQLYHKA